MELKAKPKTKLKRTIIIIFLVLNGFVILMPHTRSAPAQQPIRFLQPFWPTKIHGDPTGTVYVGDWDIFQNLYSTLVEMASANAVRPALAERWTQSADGKHWVFYLRKNLRWSDGSSMTAEQIVASLKRSVKGTHHTNLSAYVESIKALPEHQIELLLKKTPPNFLTLLAFVDSSILHPDAYKNGKFSWDAPNSGAFRVVTYNDTKIEFIANPYYWDHIPNRITNAVIVRATSSPNERIAMMLKDPWDASQINPGIIQTTEQVEQLKQKYDVFVSTPDFLFCLFFSKKRTSKNKLNLAYRQYLLKSIYDGFWNHEKNNSLRAGGLRFPKSKGAISVDQFDEIISNFKSNLFQKNKKIPKNIEIVISHQTRQKPQAEKFLNILKSMGFKVKEIIVSGEDAHEKVRLSGDFDLDVMYAGVSEYDPDTVWRYYNRYFAEPVATTEELDKAQLESDANKRNKMYQEFEKSAVEKALFIPLKYEPTYIVTSKRVILDPLLAADWGLQLFKLRMR